ncbi:MAG: DUF4097 family beta strand repeat-containing protein [Gemmatimonadaceae bacterium]
MNRFLVLPLMNRTRAVSLLLATLATISATDFISAQDRSTRTMRATQEKAREMQREMQREQQREQQQRERDREKTQSKSRSHNSDDDENTVLDTTVAVERGTIVDLSATDGKITVRGWDRNEVEIKAQSESGELQFTKSPRSVRVEGRRGTRSRTIDVVMNVRVPLNTRVVVNTMLGDVQVLDVHGEVDADLVSGDITIRGASGRTAVTNVSGDIVVSDIDGPLRVGVMSGEISMTDVRGPVEVSSNSGDVSMRGMTASAIQVQVVQGEITFDGTLSPTGNYEFGTHSGDVRLFLADNAKGTLELQSFSGTLHSSYPMVLQPDSSSLKQPMTRSFSGSPRPLGTRVLGLSQRQRLEFGGGGGAHIVVSTFDGDVHIDRGPSRLKKEQN